MKKWLNFFLIFAFVLTPFLVSTELLPGPYSITAAKVAVNPCTQKAPINFKGQCNTVQTFVETISTGLLMPSLLITLISFIYLLLAPIGAHSSIYKPPRYSPMFS